MKIMRKALLFSLLSVMVFAVAASAATVSAEDALKRLEDGNKRFLTATTGIGDVSPTIREKTAKEGQFPYAVIVACSDSRVIPESIFSAGIGELFVIRVAGFGIDKTQLGSIEYAVEHLGSPLVVVLGHTQCGAVGTALEHHEVEGNLKFIIDEISKAIGDEKHADKAVKLNVHHGREIIEGAKVQAKIVEAVYHTESGEVEFIK